MKLKFLADTSFLISTSLIGIISKLLKTDELMITEQVRSELLRMSKYRDIEGLSAKSCFKLAEAGKINIIRFKGRRIVGLGKGESSCVELFKRGKFDALCIDDMGAISRISKLIGKQNVVTTFDIMQYLYKLRMISRERKIKLIKRLLSLRKWEASRSMVELSKVYLK